MNIIYSEFGSDNFRRTECFEGSVIVLPTKAAWASIAEHARTLCHKHFEGYDPTTAESALPVEEFVKIVAALKAEFTNGAETKRLVQGFLSNVGCDLKSTYFDVPRLRVVPQHDYLHAGVSYAYRPHRDTWYSAHRAQINWWTPAFTMDKHRAMAFYPDCWGREIKNTSSHFDYDEWIRVGRKAAVDQVKVDLRNHPAALDDVGNEARLVIDPDSWIVFSADQLHGTVPNRSGATRFSVDFRTVNVDDLERKRGAPALDAKATGTTLQDFLNAANLSPFPR